MKTRLLNIALVVSCMIAMVSCESVQCILDPDAEPTGLVKGKFGEISATQMQDNYLIMNNDRFTNFGENTLKDELSSMRTSNSLEIKRGKENADIDNTDIDNTDVVFTLDNLQAYLCYVEREFINLQKTDAKFSKENINYSDYSLNDLGVRIYFGAKPNNDIDKMRTTVFLVPVIKVFPPKDNVINNFLNGGIEGVENQEDIIYIDILEIAPLNFGHARRPPKLYEGFTGQ